MTEKDIPLAELLEIRSRLFRELPASLDNDERRFLLSVKQGEPEWSLLGVPGVEHLPALQWKLHNVRKLRQGKPDKHSKMLAMLREKLQI